MEHRIVHIKDVNGQNYLGIKFKREDISNFIDELKTILADRFDTFSENQQNRDRGEYHITVINVMEYGKLTKSMGMDKFVDALQPILDYTIDDIQMSGIGKAEDKGNTAYFIACQSDKLDAVRTRFSLGKKDLHITIGFDKKDVFGVPKLAGI